jgi:hypothetical protein
MTPTTPLPTPPAEEQKSPTKGRLCTLKRTGGGGESARTRRQRCSGRAVARARRARVARAVYAAVAPSAAAKPAGRPRSLLAAFCAGRRVSPQRRRWPAAPELPPAGAPGGGGTHVACAAARASRARRTWRRARRRVRPGTCGEPEQAPPPPARRPAA